MAQAAHQQVLDAIVARLATVTLSAGRAYSDRFHPFAEDQLPGWRVYVDGKSVHTTDLMGLVGQHDVEIIVDGITRAASGMDDVLSELEAAGCAALFAAPVPFNLRLGPRIDYQVATEGEAAIGRVRLRLNCSYFIDPAEPETFY